MNWLTIVALAIMVYLVYINTIGKTTASGCASQAQVNACCATSKFDSFSKPTCNICG